MGGSGTVAVGVVLVAQNADVMAEMYHPFIAGENQKPRTVGRSVGRSVCLARPPARPRLRYKRDLISSSLSA